MIKIPFLPEFKEAILSGKKTATTRSKRYGKPGDILSMFSNGFIFTPQADSHVLTHVVQVPLYVVASFFYKEEGLDSPEAFIEVWDRIHRRKKYEDDQKLKVWLHLFRGVD